MVIVEILWNSSRSGNVLTRINWNKTIATTVFFISAWIRFSSLVLHCLLFIFSPSIVDLSPAPCRHVTVISDSMQFETIPISTQLQTLEQVQLCLGSCFHISVYMNSEFTKNKKKFSNIIIHTPNWITKIDTQYLLDWSISGREWLKSH